MADYRAQAGKIWPILVELATAKAKLTNGELAAQVGIVRRNLNRPLDAIAQHCKRNRLPALTVVIVNTDTGEPGAGFVDAAEVVGAFAAVYGFDWSSVKNPFELFVTTT